jgi:hypothetical protein
MGLNFPRNKHQSEIKSSKELLREDLEKFVFLRRKSNGILRQIVQDPVA